MQLIPASSADKRGLRLVHQDRRAAWFGIDGEGTRLNVGYVQQVGDHPTHSVGLIVDYPVKLAHFRRVQVR